MGRCLGSTRRRTALWPRSRLPGSRGTSQSPRAPFGWPAMLADPRLPLAGLMAALALTAGCGGGPGPVRIGVLSDCVGLFGAYNDVTLAAAELPLLERGARLAGRKP